LLRQYDSQSDGCPVWNSGISRQPRDVFRKNWTSTLRQGNMETSN